MAMFTLVMKGERCAEPFCFNSAAIRKWIDNKTRGRVFVYLEEKWPLLEKIYTHQQNIHCSIVSTSTI